MDSGLCYTKSGLGEKGERLAEQLVDAGIKRAESVRELLQVTGYEVPETAE